MWVGSAAAAGLRQLQLTHSTAAWSVLQPQSPQPPAEPGGREGVAAVGGAGPLTWQHGVPPDLRRTLQRRYYLVQKARDANIVGILVTGHICHIGCKSDPSFGRHGGRTEA